MPSKYILHGGATIGQKENVEFYRQMAEGLKNIGILLVYFSRDKEDWPGLKKNDKENFQAANPGNEFKFTVADENNFAKQVAESDVIYFAGGSTLKLMSTIKTAGIDLKKALEGKVVAGSSAGAHLIAKWHYGHTAKRINPGVGLVDAAVFTHYRPLEGTYFYKPEELVEKIEEGLKKTGSKTYFLKEQQSVIINPDGI
ncbi:MAG TPA: Type 1 glutamine amidotransferase-like domain-containing protein [Candidatus Saccharimonadales bacterium]|nr:Type 1 glutamine amidotransferase-like domain-containing protein [Candidatus Saccharimonadales bacterium]